MGFEPMIFGLKVRCINHTILRTQSNEDRIWTDDHKVMSLTCFPDYTTPLIEADKYCLNTYQHLSLFIYHLEQLLSRVGLHRFELWASGPKPDMFAALHHNPIQMRMPGFEPESHAPKAQMFTINTTFSWWNQNDFKSLWMNWTLISGYTVRRISIIQTQRYFKCPLPDSNR